MTKKKSRLSIIEERLDIIEEILLSSKKNFEKFKKLVIKGTRKEKRS